MFLLFKKKNQYTPTTYICTIVFIAATPQTTYTEVKYLNVVLLHKEFLWFN